MTTTSQHCLKKMVGFFLLLVELFMKLQKATFKNTDTIP